jgi:hypothetical protein
MGWYHSKFITTLRSLVKRRLAVLSGLEEEFNVEEATMELDDFEPEDEESMDECTERSIAPAVHRTKALVETELEKRVASQVDTLMKSLKGIFWMNSLVKGNGEFELLDDSGDYFDVLEDSDSEYDE